MTSEITDLDKEMLALESLWYQHAGVKERTIREKFELSPTQYYAALNALLDVPAAMEFDPMLVKRLRRRRGARGRSRAAGGYGTDA